MNGQRPLLFAAVIWQTEGPDMLAEAVLGRSEKNPAPFPAEARIAGESTESRGPAGGSQARRRERDAKGDPEVSSAPHGGEGESPVQSGFSFRSQRGLQWELRGERNTSRRGGHERRRSADSIAMLGMRLDRSGEEAARAPGLPLHSRSSRE